jgi:hypothetical protein
MSNKIYLCRREGLFYEGLTYGKYPPVYPMEAIRFYAITVYASVPNEALRSYSVYRLTQLLSTSDKFNRVKYYAPPSEIAHTLKEYPIILKL